MLRATEGELASVRDRVNQLESQMRSHISIARQDETCELSEAQKMENPDVDGESTRIQELKKSVSHHTALSQGMEEYDEPFPHMVGYGSTAARNGRRPNDV